MKELQRKQKTRRILYSIPSLLILFIIATLLAKGAMEIIIKERESRERLTALKEKASALVLREQELSDGIARLQTEKGIKDEIKDRFSVIQEGEHVAIIVDERRSATSTEDSELPWYKKLWAVLTGSK